MLMGALFADAMGRDIMPERYPYPMRDAAPATSGCFFARLARRRRRAFQPRRELRYESP